MRKAKIQGLDLSGRIVETENVIPTELSDLSDGSVVQTKADISYVDNKFNGAVKAIAYDSYSTMITAFNALDDETYRVGQDVYIVTQNVPDLWVSGVESTSVPYTYVDDATFTSALATNGYVQVGYYKLSALETQKVDLTNYATINTDQTITGKKAIENSGTNPRSLPLYVSSEVGGQYAQNCGLNYKGLCYESKNPYTTGYKSYKLDKDGFGLSKSSSAPSDMGSFPIKLNFPDVSNGTYTLALTSDIPTSFTASDVNSEQSTQGQVLTADGSGGASWQNASGGKLYRHIVKLQNTDTNKTTIYVEFLTKSSTTMTQSDILTILRNGYVGNSSSYYPCFPKLKRTVGTQTSVYLYVGLYVLNSTTTTIRASSQKIDTSTFQTDEAVSYDGLDTTYISDTVTEL